MAHNKQFLSMFLNSHCAFKHHGAFPFLCNTSPSHVALNEVNYFCVLSHILFVPVPVTSSLMGNYFRPDAEAMLLHQPPIDWLPIVLSFHKHFKVRFPCLNNGLQAHEKRLRGK